MGRRSRDKGARGERELASLLPGARKVSTMYGRGHDVRWRGYDIEVRRRKDTYESMNRIEHELQDSELYATRLDYGEWFLVMRPDTLLDLIGD